MNQPLSPEEPDEIFQAIDNEVTEKLSELTKNAGFSLAKGYIGADLTSKNFSGDNLSNANLSNTNLSKSNLSGADLSDTILVESNLNGANLRNANLINADFSNANVEKAQFGNNQGISIQTRADLIQRGAIFVA